MAGEMRGEMRADLAAVSPVSERIPRAVLAGADFIWRRRRLPLVVRWSSEMVAIFRRAELIA